MFKHGEAQPCRVMQLDPAWGALPPQWVTYFLVADVDGALAAVTGNGGTAMRPIEETPFGRMAAGSDPGGAHFKLIEPPRG